MKKFLCLFIFIFSVSSYSVIFNEYDVKNINSIKTMESQVAEPFYIPKDNELINGNEIYPIIKKVSEKMDANIYRSCLKVNKDGDYEEVKYLLVNNYETSILDAVKIDKGDKLVELTGDRFYSTDKTHDKKQIGLIRDFGKNDNISIYEFNKLYKNYPVSGLYYVEIDGNFDEFIKLLCDEINLSIGTKLNVTDFDVEKSDNSEIVLKTNNIMLKIAMYIVLFMTIMLISFIIFYSSKKISIFMLHGTGVLKTWSELFQKNINKYYMISTLILIGYSIIKKLPIEFIINMVVRQGIYYIVLSMILYMPYIIIIRKSMKLSLNNKTNTKSLIIINSIFKLTLILFLVKSSIFIVNDWDDLNKKMESLNNWEKSKNYGVVYPVLVGDDDVANPRTEIDAVEKLYSLLNKKGSLFINSRAYEDMRNKSNFEDVYESIIVNPNYLDEFPIYDIENKKVSISEDEVNWILLVSEKYKSEIDKITEYIRLTREASYDYEITQFTGKKYDNLISQEIKIIWIKDNQEIFSFNSEVNKDNNNMVEGKIIEVVTEKNSYPIDKFGILGGGNRDPIKIKLENYDTEETYNSLLPYFNEWKISDNYTTIINSNELVLSQIENLKSQIKMMIVKFIVVLIAFLVIIIQNITLIFNHLNRRIIIRRLFGMNFYSRYREVLIILMITWFFQIIIAKVIFVRLSIIINLILIILFMIEIIFMYIQVSLLEKKNIVKVLKGE